MGETRSDPAAPRPLSAGSRFLLTAAGFVVVIAGMRAAHELLVPLLLALFVAVIAAPGLGALKQRGVPTPLALLVIIAGLALAALLFVALLGSSMDDFMQSRHVYEQRLGDIRDSLRNTLSAAGIEIGPDKWKQVVNPGAAFGIVGDFAANLGGVLSNSFLIGLLVIFLLAEAADFPRKLRAVSCDPDGSMTSATSIMTNLHRYMAMKSCISALTGIVVGLMLWAIGVDFPALWGVLAFLLNFVPNLGSILAAIPPVLLALIQLGGGAAAGAALGFVIINVVVGNVIEPRMMGKGLGLSTLVVFLSLVFWGWVLGPVGMLLSVPLTMTVKIVLESRADLRWIAVLLGSAAATDPQPAK